MMRPLRTARSISSIRLLAVVAGLLPTAACTEDASVSTTTVDFEVSEGTNLAFDISPDGETIVFDLLGQLWLLPAAGGAARPITDAVRDTAEDLDPVFSPDGRWIAFQTDRPGSLGLMVMPAEGGEPGTLTPDGWLPWGHVSPSWSPDGSELLLASWDSIYRLDMESRDMRSIPIELPAAAPPAVRLDGPAWAPDGASFAFGSDSAQEPWFRAFVSANARIWRVDVLGGEATPLGPDGQQAVGVEYAPDGRQVAYFAPDSVGRWQVWVRPVEGGEPVRVTDHDDVAYRRVRWTPQGESLIYSADGRLWRVASEGGSPDEIAFTARLTFQRHRPNLPPVRFPDPGTTRAARGFRGLALSHDGSRIGMLALGRLWVWSIGETPRSVTAVPITARDLSWSPDGTSVAYSDQALFVVDLETAATWQLTDLEGLSQGPVWSPDGEHIAFVYREEPTSPGGRASAQFRVVDANARGVTDMASTRDVGPAMDSRFFDAASVSWARDSTLLTYVTDDDRTTGIAMSLDGAFDTLPRFPSGPAYLSMPLKDTVVYVKGNRLWAARVDARAGMIGEPWVLSDDPALFPTAASSGAVLYVSGDGLRLRQPSGDTRTLGWPVRYDVPQAPGSLLIRNVRIIDGRDIPPTGLHDLLIEAGRIAAIDPSQESRMASAVDTLDGGGKTVIPGLIDLHQHLSAGAAQQAAGALYHGTTTVRDAGSALANTAALRDLIDSGGWPGPRVVFSGMVFHGGDWLGGMGNDVNQYVTDSAQIGRGVAVARAFGSDYVKYRGFHDRGRYTRSAWLTSMECV